MSLIERARASGRCPPSLLQEESSDGANGFEAAVTQILDANGTSIVRFMCCNNSLRTYFLMLIALFSFYFTPLKDLSLSSDQSLVDDFKSLLQVRFRR
jgi:hypothetical protein